MAGKKNGIWLIVLLSGLAIAGCVDPSSKAEGNQKIVQTEERSNSAKAQDNRDADTGELQGADRKAKGREAAKDSGKDGKVEQKKDKEPDILDFVDVFGNAYQVEINPNVQKHDYRMELLSHDGDRLSYKGDDNYSYRLGVDVSYHSGIIDWQKVKSAGYDFAFVRLGYRGYGKAGAVCLDTQFHNNVQNAQAAGIDVGIYFFSQAINESEAAQEAEFVLENLNGYTLQLPVVYDPEHILDDEARTDDVKPEQFTKNTDTFCKMVADAGYQPMIYSNMLWEAFQFDLEKLSSYPIWYADYEALPQTPYVFECWQYSNEGIVDGINGMADLDIQFIKEERK